MRRSRTACVAHVAVVLVGRSWAVPRPAAGSWGRCVYVANDHGQVIREWLEAARDERIEGPLSVLHVDAHNDMNVPELTLPEDVGRGWESDPDTMERLADSADLANYQQVAAWSGLVDRVVWVRQGWGTVDDNELLLEYSHGQNHFVEHLLGTKVVGRGAEPRATLLDAGAGPCRLRSGCQAAADDAGASGNRSSGGGPRCRQPQTPPGQVPLRYVEVPEAALLSDACAGGVASALASAPYVLDIDLDFLAPPAAVPPRPPWLAVECPQACTRWPEPDCPLWRELASAVDGSQAFLRFCAAESISAWRGLDESTRVALDALSVPEKLLVAAHFLGDKAAPPAAVNRTALRDKLGTLLGLLARLHGSPPALVTIARSSDAFLDIFHVALLEEAVLDMIAEVWPSGLPDNPQPCVKYAPGTVPIDTLHELSRLFPAGHNVFL